MKHFLICLAFFTTILVVRAETFVLNGVAAVVDAEYITYGDVKARAWSDVEKLLKKYEGAALKEHLRSVYGTALNHLVESKIVALAFKAKGGEVTDSMLEGRIAEIVREKFDNDRVKLISTLENDGSSYEEWTKYVREQMIMAGMVAREIDAKISIPPAAVQAEYEKRRAEYEVLPKNKVRMYDIGDAADRTVADKQYLQKLAGRVRTALADGQSIDKTLQADSEARRFITETALGWIESGDVKPEIARALTGMKEGDVSVAIAIGDRWYIVKIEEQKSGYMVPFTDVQKELERELRIKARAELYRTWIERLKTQYRVATNSLDPLL